MDTIFAVKCSTDHEFFTSEEEAIKYAIVMMNANDSEDRWIETSENSWSRGGQIIKVEEIDVYSRWSDEPLLLSELKDLNKTPDDFEHLF